MEASDADNSLPEEFTTLQHIKVTIPTDVRLPCVRVPIVFKTPFFIAGVEMKCLPVRAEVMNMSLQGPVNIGLNFSFIPTAELMVSFNPVTEQIEAQTPVHLMLISQIGGTSRAGNSDPIVLFDRSKQIRALEEEVNRDYFGLQPSEVFKSAPRSLINNTRHVLLLSGEGHHATRPMLKYLTDNKSHPLFKKAVVFSDGVTAIQEDLYHEIFAPMEEKLGEFKFIPINQYVTLSRVDNLPFAEPSPTLAEHFTTSVYAQPFVVEFTVRLSYFLLKPNVDPTGVSNLVAGAISQDMARDMRTTGQPHMPPQMFQSMQPQPQQYFQTSGNFLTSQPNY